MRPAGALWCVRERGAGADRWGWRGLRPIHLGGRRRGRRDEEGERRGGAARGESPAAARAGPPLRIRGGGRGSRSGRAGAVEQERWSRSGGAGAVFGGALSALLELTLCWIDVRGHGAADPPAGALAAPPSIAGAAEGGRLSAEGWRAWVVRHAAAQEQAAADAFRSEVAADEVLPERAAAVMAQRRSVRSSLRAVAGAGVPATAAASGAGGAAAGGEETAPRR